MALSLHNFANGQSSSTNTVSATLTVSVGEIIVVVVSNEDVSGAVKTVTGISDGTANSYAKRFSASASGAAEPRFGASEGLEVWWAYAANSLTGATITATLSASTDDSAIIVAGYQGFTGTAYQTAPWDTNASLPKTAQAATTTMPTASGISTSSSAGILLAVAGSCDDGAFPAAPSGFSLVDQVKNSGANNAVQVSDFYEVYASQQTAITVTTTTNNLNGWIFYVDALTIPSGAAVLETNVNTAGRYRPTQINLSPVLRFNQAVDFIAAAAVVATETYFIGSYKPTKYLLNKSVFQNYSTFDVVSETNIHFIGKYKPASLYKLQPLWQNSDIEPPVVETNTNFIGSFRQTKINVLAGLRSTLDTEPPVTETNTHFLARFTPAKLRVPSNLRFGDDIEPPVSETNVSFVGKYTSTKIFKLQSLWQNSDIQPPVIETNVHFVGKFSSTKVNLLHSLWRNIALEPAQAAPEPETNINFIGKFISTKLNVPLFYREHQDYLPDVIETNPHFLGRFKSTVLNNLLSLRSNSDPEVPFIVVVETNTSFIGRFTPTVLTVDKRLRQHHSYLPDVVGTETYFTGKFKPIKYFTKSLTSFALDIPVFISRAFFRAQIFG